MEQVLELYQQPYDPKHPVVCMDEQPKQLIDEIRSPALAKPGQVAKNDYEYIRHGVCNVWMFVEPLAGWRQVTVTEQRTREDWAQQIRRLVDSPRYAEAERITLVCDNLNTHRLWSLYEAFEAEEALRIARRLSRAREDMKAIELKARQRLGAFLLRHGRIYSGKSRWTQAHFRWLETVTFDSRVQQFILQVYVDAVLQAQRRIARLEDEMRRALPQWRLGPVVEALMALRGMDLVSAMVTMAELGGITRFDSPRQLMAHLGLVPSEHSSGSKRRQGAITKTGNGHLRRILVEAAWSYRFPARKTKHLQRRAEKASENVQAIA